MAVLTCNSLEIVWLVIPPKLVLFGITIAAMSVFPSFKLRYTRGQFGVSRDELLDRTDQHGLHDVAVEAPDATQMVIEIVPGVDGLGENLRYFLGDQARAHPVAADRTGPRRGAGLPESPWVVHLEPVELDQRELRHRIQAVEVRCPDIVLEPRVGRVRHRVDRAAVVDTDRGETADDITPTEQERGGGGGCSGLVGDADAVGLTNNRGAVHEKTGLTNHVAVATNYQGRTAGRLASYSPVVDVPVPVPAWGHLHDAATASVAERHLARHGRDAARWVEPPIGPQIHRGPVVLDPVPDTVSSGSLHVVGVVVGDAEDARG